MLFAPTLLVIALAAPAAPPRAGIVVAGPDAAAAGGLQRRLEAKLAGSVAPSSELAKRLGTPAQAPATDMVLQREAERLLDATQKAFYDGNLDDALARISELDKLTIDAPAMPLRNRALLLLWRAAVLLEKGAGPEASEAPAREALSYWLVPPLSVDEKTFPPAVVALAAKLRKSPATAKLTVTGLPAGTGFRLDDAEVTVPPTGGAFAVSVPAGRHRLQAWSPGYAQTTLSTDVFADSSVAVSLPLALDPADSLAMMEAAAGRVDRSRLDALAKRLDVDVLVVATQKSVSAPITAFLWKKKLETAPVVPPSPAGEDSLAIWIAQRLAPKSAANDAGGAARPRRSVTPSVSAFAAVRTFDVAGEGGGYSALFGGPGMRAGVVGTWGDLLAMAEGSYATYALSPVTADLPDGGTASGSGGTTVAGSLAGGWRFSREGLTPWLAAGVSFEQHTADDLAGSDGALQFFPSHDRLSLDMSAGMSWPLSFGTVQAHATVQPFSVYEETPLTTGRDATPGLGFVFDAGVERPYGAWLLAARYRGERLSVGFRGASSAPLTPAIEDASVTETAHSFAMTAGRRF